MTVTLRDVSADYGTAAVLRNVSVEIPARGVTVLLGRNGAGKTTLLRAISGLVPARSGTVTMGSDDITKWSPQRRVRAGIGHVPEGRRILAGLTVRENLEAGAYMLSRARAREHIDRVLEDFVPALAPMLEKEGSSLSGGQQQLLAIGRALVLPVSTLLLDEPFTGLSPLAVGQIVEVLRRVRDGGVGLLVVEQTVQTALEIADQAYLIDRGRVVQHASTDSSTADLEAVRQAYLGVSGTSVGATYSSSP